MPRIDLIQARRGTTAEWNASPPGDLAAGEFGWDEEAEILKIGDGVSSWNTLPASVYTLADAAETAAGAISTKAVTPAGLAGVRASGDETIVGSSATKFVTPAGLKAALPHVNVKSYGAVGDGVTDDRLAIVAARNAAGPGGVIEFPLGNYFLSTGVSGWSQGQRLVGAPGATITLSAGATAGDVCLSLNTGSDVTVSGLTFQCLGAVGSYNCIRVRNVDRTVIEDCTFLSDGVRFDFTTRNSRVQGCRLEGGRYGILAKDPVLLDGLAVVGCVGLTTDAGAFVSVDSAGGVASNVTIADCLITSNGTSPPAAGIALANAQDVSVVGNVIRNCDEGVHIEDGSGYVSVTGNVVDGCSVSGINMTDSAGSPIRASRNLAIVGNTIRGCRKTATTTTRGAINLIRTSTAASEGVVLGGNIIYDNGNATDVTHGIRLGIGTKDAVIVGNVVRNTSGGAGIKVEGATTNVTIANNVCTDDRATGKTQTYGLETVGVQTDMTLSTNNFRGNLTGETNIADASGLRLGFYASSPIAKPSVAAAATDAATTQTLANALRTALINLGLVS